MIPKRSSIDDIFSLEKPGSFVRSHFTRRVRLSELSLELPIFTPDKAYTIEELTIMEDQDTLDHQDRIAEICKLGRGIDGYERFHVGVIEAFRNAYQHGNRKDPNKNIQLAYRRGSDYF